MTHEEMGRRVQGLLEVYKLRTEIMADEAHILALQAQHRVREGQLKILEMEQRWIDFDSKASGFLDEEKRQMENLIERTPKDYVSMLCLRDLLLLRPSSHSFVQHISHD